VDGLNGGEGEKMETEAQTRAEWLAGLKPGSEVALKDLNGPNHDIRTIDKVNKSGVYIGHSRHSLTTGNAEYWGRKIEPVTDEIRRSWEARIKKAEKISKLMDLFVKSAFGLNDAQLAAIEQILNA
jgi:hypothetical protein